VRAQAVSKEGISKKKKKKKDGPLSPKLDSALLLFSRGNTLTKAAINGIGTPM
jgi:hypothetical protein